jgi:hypothetical protein
MDLEEKSREFNSPIFSSIFCATRSIIKKLLLKKNLKYPFPLKKEEDGHRRRKEKGASQKLLPKKQLKMNLAPILMLECNCKTACSPQGMDVRLTGHASDGARNALFVKRTDP